MRLNRDWSSRDRIVFGQETPRYLGGIERFEKLPLANLQMLVDGGYADLDERQNSSPTLASFLAFMQRWNFALAHGYVISHERSDYGVVIEGLEGRAPDDISNDELRIFLDEWRRLLNEQADDNREPWKPGDVFYCWFD